MKRSKAKGKILVNVFICLMIGLIFNSLPAAEANSYLATTTPTGFYYPTGKPPVYDPPQEYGYDGACTYYDCPGWLAREDDYWSGYYHIGQDIEANVEDNVYAISDGRVRYISHGGWGTDNVGIFVKHKLNDGTEFLALYGHIRSSVKVGDDIDGGKSFATIGPFGNEPHLHFGIHPGTSLPPSNPSEKIGWGRMGIKHWPNTNGFVDPIAWITTKIPFGLLTVEKGLHWLRTQQNPDGSWRNSVAITSMTALAFLNAGYTEDDPTVNKAIQYILDNKNADRSFGRETYDTASEYNLTNRSADRSFSGTYETSTAVWALIATHNPDYNDEIADAKDWLINAQYDEGEGIDSTNPYYGGWSYGLEPSWADLSNTQFALMALDAANLPKSSDVWAKAITYISRCQNRPASNDQNWAHDDTKPSYNDGGFIYCPEWGFAPEFGDTGSYGSITAAGIWSFRLCGVDVSDGRVQAGLNWLANNEDCSFDDNPGHPYGQEHCFLYYYYMSLAKALVMCFEDDLICDDWYAALSIKLIDLQHDDRYWINTAASHGQEDIPEIATDFAILALQTKQPPAADLWMSVILASNATLTVYDPQGRYARLGDITIPGATFEIDGDGRQIVNLTELEAGKYRVELKGTADGDYSLTIEGYRDEEKTSSETFESTIKEGEYQKSDVLVTSMVGALTIIAEEPKDLLVTDLPNVELVSADPTVTSINVTGLSLSEIDTTYKPAGVIPQSAYMINSTGAGSFTLRYTDILDASAIIVYKINTTNQWIEILDTTTTANTVTFTMEVGDPPVVFGLTESPSSEQPQFFKEKSSVQGKGYISIEKKVQDWKVAVDVEEYMEGFGEFSMNSCEILNESARRSDPTDPNYYNQKLINFEGNNTNRLTSFAKYESPAFYGGTGAKVNEFFNVSAIQKQEFGSIKTDSALGTAQSLDFATMDDFYGIWGIHSGWQKICQKDIRHHQMFAGNFSVQKDLTFEREVVIP